MKHQSFGEVINGDAAMKLATALGFKSGIAELRFMKRHKLSLADHQALLNCLNQYWKHGKAETFLSNVAMVFQKYGFDVRPDDDTCNFIIS